MDSIDKLLAQLKAEYEEVQPKQQQQTSNIPKSFIQASAKSASLIDNLLAEVKADFAQEDAVLELKRQEEIQQAKRQEEQLKAKEIEALKKQAKDWLNKLDPFSPEGLWFERFSEGYPSKLEAAIEYLQTN
ncbi:hypothetical protein WKK05_34735 [Nostoc sp. UHCC 0302]|uniref:salt stress protein, Slr1339 family n=1 Tax=Nostoc sp. UHCC 0302 TaxID=3134896 RepID=UPI00311CD245